MTSASTVSIQLHNT